MGVLDKGNGITRLTSRGTSYNHMGVSDSWLQSPNCHFSTGKMGNIKMVCSPVKLQTHPDIATSESVWFPEI